MTFPNDAYGKRTLDFVETLHRLDGYEDVCRAIVREIEWFGYDCLTAFTMPAPGADAASGIMMNNRPAAYIERYVERNYLAYDPAIQELRRNLNPYSWGDIRRTRKLNKLERTIIDEASEFGFGDGLVVPIVSLSGSMAVFGACGGEPDLSPRARAAMELIGIYSAQALKRALDRQHPAEAPRAPLTPREREIMQWVAAGRSDEEIADILSLSTRAVTWHVENAKRKLDAYRRPYAVVQALRFGEISL